MKYSAERVEKANSARWASVTLASKVWSKVDQSAGSKACWPWTGHVGNYGYGVLQVDGHNRGAHRLVYALVVGPIPEGLTLDHLCRNRACVNPRHLEPVARGENVRRGIGPTAENARRTHCIRGHAFAGDNLLIRKNGSRGCRTCRHAANRQRPLRSSRIRALRDAAQDGGR